MSTSPPVPPGTADPTPVDLLLPGGVRLQAMSRGGGDRGAIIALHGYTDSCWSVGPLLAALPDDIRAVALTQRGHGDADRPGDYRMQAFAADVVGAMDALEVEDAVLVGHSMGTSVALRAALTAPDRVRGLVLIGALHRTATSGPIAELADAVEGLVDPVDRAFIEEFQRSTVITPLPKAFLDLVVDESGKLTADRWREVLAGLRSGDLSGQLHAVDVPVRLLWGAHDDVTDHEAQLGLVEELPQAHLITYPDAGHAPHWEHPARVAADVATFVAELYAPSTVTP